jgi:hypothetical protein
VKSHKRGHKEGSYLTLTECVTSNNFRNKKAQLPRYNSVRESEIDAAAALALVAHPAVFFSSLQYSRSLTRRRLSINFWSLYTNLSLLWKYSCRYEKLPDVQPLHLVQVAQSKTNRRSQPKVG